MWNILQRWDKVITQIQRLQRDLKLWSTTGKQPGSNYTHYPRGPPTSWPRYGLHITLVDFRVQWVLLVWWYDWTVTRESLIASMSSDSRKRGSVWIRNLVSQLTSSLAILFLPSHNSSRFTRASKFSIFWNHGICKHGFHRPNANRNTRILFPPSSRLFKVVTEPKFAILVIRFWTK